MAGLFEWLAERKMTKEERKAKAMYDGMHDKRTGLYNEYGFQMLYKDSDQRHIAIIEFEPSDYRNMPKKLGDEAVKKLSEVVSHSFRSVDHVCRVSESEILVIMVRINSALEEVVLEKVESIRKSYNPVTVGIAFGDKTDQDRDVLKCADSAFMKARLSGWNTCVVYHHRND